MNKVTTIGIDLAKNVFQLHGADRDGKKVYSKRLSRAEIVTFLAKHEPCVIGIESCGGSFHWARMFTKMGHTVKVMAPQFVKPYVKADKTDSNDARAIAEAVTRPDMSFVPHKTLEQQDLQLIHQVRELAIKQRTSLINQLRGLLNEYGLYKIKNTQRKKVKVDSEEDIFKALGMKYLSPKEREKFNVKK